MMQRVSHVNDLSPVMRDILSGAKLSDEEKAKIKNWAYTVKELTPDHTVYALQMGWKGACNNLLAVVEELAGADIAAKVAETIAARQ